MLFSLNGKFKASPSLKLNIFMALATSLPTLPSEKSKCDYISAFIN
jgi:hypothetical protein